jgi:hypothetical protein
VFLGRQLQQLDRLLFRYEPPLDADSFVGHLGALCVLVFTPTGSFLLKIALNSEKTLGSRERSDHAIIVFAVVIDIVMDALRKLTLFTDRFAFIAHTWTAQRV